MSRALSSQPPHGGTRREGKQCTRVREATATSRRRAPRVGAALPSVAGDAASSRHGFRAAATVMARWPTKREHQRVMHSSHANHPSTSCAACRRRAACRQRASGHRPTGRRRGAARRPSRNGAPEGPGRRAARPQGRQALDLFRRRPAALPRRRMAPARRPSRSARGNPPMSLYKRKTSPNWQYKLYPWRRTAGTGKHWHPRQSAGPGIPRPAEGRPGTRRGSARSRAIRGTTRSCATSANARASPAWKRRRFTCAGSTGTCPASRSPISTATASTRSRSRSQEPRTVRTRHGIVETDGRQRRHRASRDRRAEVGVECGGRMGMAGARAGHETREDRLETHPLADPGRSGTAARRTARASRRHGAFQSGDRPAPRQRDGAAVVASRPRAARRVDPPDQAKARKAITVPLSETAIAVLRRQHANPRAPECADSVFTYRGRPVYQTATAAWAALQRAGLSDFRWHDLRHTWASWHVQRGTPLQVLRSWADGETMEMVQRYAHLSADHLAQWVTPLTAGVPVPAAIQLQRDNATNGENR